MIFCITMLTVCGFLTAVALMMDNLTVSGQNTMCVFAESDKNPLHVFLIRTKFAS